MIFGTGPEVDALRDLRDAAIADRAETLARDLCNHPAALMEWLDDQSMSLADIMLVHPASAVRASADTMLLRSALHSEHVGPVSLGWMMEQIQQWLVKRPELIEEATKSVDTAATPGRAAP